jgi:hypothetical protein
MGMIKASKRSSINLITYRIIQELAAYREQHITEKGTTPPLLPVCRRIGIGHRTVRKHAPQLVERWKDKDFHW